MAQKKIQPKNPGAKAAKATGSKSESTTTGRKIAASKFGGRKSARKTSGFKYGG